MERQSLNPTYFPCTIPADLLAVGFARGCQCSMRVEEVSATRLLLRTKYLMRPLDQIDLMCWLDPQEEPIYAIAQAQYIEKTWAGYCVDAQLLRMASGDRERWERYIARAELKNSGVSPKMQIESCLHRMQLVNIGTALPVSVRSFLREQGLIVHHVTDLGRALKLRARRPDIFIADSASSAIDLPKLCQELAAMPSAPDLLLFVEYASEKDMDRCLRAGATRVILKPCNQESLIRRILTTLVERTELQTAAYSSSNTLSPVVVTAKSKTPASAAPGFWTNLRGHLRGIFRDASTSATR